MTRTRTGDSRHRLRATDPTNPVKRALRAETGADSIQASPASEGAIALAESAWFSTLGLFPFSCSLTCQTLGDAFCLDQTIEIDQILRSRQQSLVGRYRTLQLLKNFNRSLKSEFIRIPVPCHLGYATMSWMPSRRSKSHVPFQQLRASQPFLVRGAADNPRAHLEKRPQMDHWRSARYDRPIKSREETCASHDRE